MGATGQLLDFIQSHIRSTRVKPTLAPPDLARCLLVEEVAEVSVAAHAGVSAGDVLVTLDGKEAALCNPDLYRDFAEAHRYVFHSAARGKTTELEVSGIDIGAKLARTPDAMRARGSASAHELEALWKAGEWALLEELARRAVEAQRDQPALALLGAALCETGRAAEGEALTEEYARDLRSRWTMCFAAVALYYNGLAALRRGEQRAGVQLLAEAFRNEPYPRIADAMEKHTGTRPEKPRSRWLGRRFPVDYRLDQIGSPNAVGLTGTMALMAPHRILVVCLLANYRGNGPYNDFMLRYRSFATFFRPFVQGLHVITMERRRPPDREHCWVGEDAVRAANLPFTLLEERGEVTTAVDSPGSPHILVLDRERKVLYEGQLSGLEFWRVIAALPEAPAAAFSTAPGRSPSGERAILGDPVPTFGGGEFRWVRWGLIAFVVFLFLASARACRPRRSPVEERPQDSVILPAPPRGR
jgi:hypothetical protein